ncbi:hypothetical protein E4T79_02450 [Streptococcus sp. LYSM12]|nr:hypothetical protein E4T79_02450 [Streptococcus sp. LYSM12]
MHVSIFALSDCSSASDRYIVISFIFYYFVNSLYRTLVQPAAPCLVLKINETAILKVNEKTISTQIHPLPCFIFCSYI